MNSDPTLRSYPTTGAHPAAAPSVPNHTPTASLPPINRSSYIDIPDLLRHARRSSPVRHLVEALFAGTFAPLDTVSPLFTALACNERSQWQERVLAAWALGRAPLSPAERDSAAAMLIAVLRAPRGRTRAEKIRRGFTWTLYPLAPIWLIVSGIIANAGGFPWPEVLVQGLMMFGLIGSAITVPASLLTGRTVIGNEAMLRAAAAESLGHLRSEDSVGALATALFDRSAIVREAASSALNRILPTLTAEHYGEFSRQTISDLGRVLRRSMGEAKGISRMRKEPQNTDMNMVTEILNALEKIGTSHVLKDVELVARLGPTEKIKVRAQHVADVLEGRQRYEDQSRMLVRASAPSAGEDQLLRATFSRREDADPIQYLRAADGEGETMGA